MEYQLWAIPLTPLKEALQTSDLKTILQKIQITGTPRIQKMVRDQQGEEAIFCEADPTNPYGENYIFLKEAPWFNQLPYNADKKVRPKVKTTALTEIFRNVGLKLKPIFSWDYINQAETILEECQNAYSIYVSVTSLKPFLPPNAPENIGMAIMDDKKLLDTIDKNIQKRCGEKLLTHIKAYGRHSLLLHPERFLTYPFLKKLKHGETLQTCMGHGVPAILGFITDECHFEQPTIINL